MSILANGAATAFILNPRNRASNAHQIYTRVSGSDTCQNVVEAGGREQKLDTQARCRKLESVSGRTSRRHTLPTNRRPDPALAPDDEWARLWPCRFEEPVRSPSLPFSTMLLLRPRLFCKSASASTMPFLRSRCHRPRGRVLPRGYVLAGVFFYADRINGELGHMLTATALPIQSNRLKMLAFPSSLT
jgi:hypothetical protein